MYTKGEWKAKKGSGDWWWVDCWKDGNYVGNIASMDSDYLEDGEPKANAQLIASAPDLYEALKEMLYDDVPGTQAIGLAEKALAKAKGGSR